MNEIDNNTDDEVNDVCHQIWLVYSQLKDAESDPERRYELLENSREKLGKALNRMYRWASVMKSPRSQAANSNCHDLQFNLTPDRHL